LLKISFVLDVGNTHLLAKIEIGDGWPGKEVQRLLRKIGDEAEASTSLSRDVEMKPRTPEHNMQFGFGYQKGTNAVSQE
jgi:hypothetical protein